jgi:SpoVK/Ycf46/Vps4 family AAA+-type ATPase
MRAVRELFDKKELMKPQARPITMDDFREIIRKRKPSVSSQMLVLYDKWFETYKAL